MKTWTLKNINDGSFAYVLQASARDVWQEVISTELLGTGHTRGTLRAQGWRAVQASLENPEEIAQLRRMSEIQQQYTKNLEAGTHILREEIRRLKYRLYEAQSKVIQLEKQINPDRTRK